jgi:hypothetical protein
LDQCDSPSAHTLTACIGRTGLAPFQQIEIDPPVKMPAVKLQFSLPILRSVHELTENHWQHLPF